MTTGNQPQSAAERLSAGSVVGPNLGRNVPQDAVRPAQPATLRELVSVLLDSAEERDFERADATALAEIERRLERARSSGAGQSTNGQRVLAILDGTE